MLLFTVWEEWPWMRPAAFASYNKTDVTFEFSCKLCKVTLILFLRCLQPGCLVSCKTECGNKADDAQISKISKSDCANLCLCTLSAAL